ncbi:B2 protein-like [Pistacia vera]|uniref:B2 protein-like n=1 Tax=Pistacia vera TaxID=55513 RepID=UPI0012637685|nr:B2 protein-like [Pistacia vera]
MENNQQSFWQFSDQLRLQSSNLANLSLNDSIWSNNYGSKRPDERRNFDIRVGGEVNSLNNSLKPTQVSDLNGFNDAYKMGINDGYKMGINNNNNNNNNSNNLNSNYNINDFGLGPIGPLVGGASHKNVGINGGFNKGIYSKPGNFGLANNNYMNVNLKGKQNKEEYEFGGKGGKKNGHKKNQNKDGDNNNETKEKNAADKRFKTLPPSEALPRHETIGGYIFVCNNDTMAENLKRELFGLPPRYRDSVRAITPGLPLFLYNYSTHQLHGVFEAASFGGTNIDPTAWEDKKCSGESRFPAQVRVFKRKNCAPLEEDSFRPILHHYDGPKFRLELNIPEALSLLDIFEEQDPEAVNQNPAILY